MKPFFIYLFGSNCGFFLKKQIQTNLGFEFLIRSIYDDCSNRLLDNYLPLFF
jgi:hypothetical protein